MPYLKLPPEPDLVSISEIFGLRVSCRKNFVSFIVATKRLVIAVTVAGLAVAAAKMMTKRTTAGPQRKRLRWKRRKRMTPIQISELRK